MSKILIIGNSLAAASAAEYIRKTDAASEITLFCPEGLLPYNRSLLPALVAKDIKEPQAYANSDKFFKGHNINVITADELSRISIKRKNIANAKKEQTNFDKLLLTDAPAVKVPAVKGHQREGVFECFTLKSVKALVKQIPYFDNVIVQVSNLSGFNMACALTRAGKQVIAVCETSGLLNNMFDEESSSLLKQVVESKGLRVLTGEGIVEILGDAQVKAVRLKSGKVIAAEAVVFDQVTPDLRMLSESGLMEEEAIKINEFFNTGVADVSACEGIVSQFDLAPEHAIEMGRCAASNLLNPGSNPYQPPFVTRTFGEKVCDGFFGGAVRITDGGRELMNFDGPANIYKKIYLLNDCLVGAVWFNAIADKDKVQEALIQKMSLAGNEDRFLHA